MIFLTVLVGVTLYRSNQEWTVYDASGQRVLTRTTSSSGTSLTTYPFGTEEHQYDSSGNPLGTGTYYYTFAGKLIGVLLGTTMEFVLTDDLGSVRTAITTQAGAATVVDYMGYGPFGFLQYHAGQTGTNKGYTGQYNDPLSGLDYYVARYYDPVVVLFLSADTVQSNLKGFDPYAYVGENPETKNDPTGKRFSCGMYCDGTLTPRPISSGPSGNPTASPPFLRCGLPCEAAQAGGGNTGTGGGLKLPLPTAPKRHPADSSACASSPWGCVTNWNNLLGGAGLVLLGGSIMLASILNFTNPVMALVQVAARMMLKNALNGVVWMISTGIRMVMSAFSNVPIIARVIADTAIVLLDAIAVVNNLANIFNFFKTVSLVGTIGSGIARIVSAGQTLIESGPNAVGPLMMKNLNLFGGLSAVNVLGVGQLISDGVTWINDLAILNSQQ